MHRKWAKPPDRYLTRSGLRLTTLSRGALAELDNIVNGAARGLQTKNMILEPNVKVDIVVESDAPATISISSRVGVGKTRHVETRCLRKCRGTENVADMGTKALEPKRHKALLSELHMRSPTARQQDEERWCVMDFHARVTGGP